jgi:hypothetical protein
MITETKKYYMLYKRKTIQKEKLLSEVHIL